MITTKYSFMEITGKIIAVLEERSGTSARTGTEWKVATYVLETISEQYPRRMCFEVFGVDKIQTMNIQLGETLTVKFDIDAHEYNGRWYNSIRAFAVNRNMSEAPVASVAPAAAPVVDATPFNPNPVSQSSETSDPFPAMGGDGELPF